MLLGQGMRIWGVAGDDAHLNHEKRRYSDAGVGWVEIWAAEKSEAAVLQALKGGAFFSTQGPVFEAIDIQPDSISIRCSPVRQIRWRTFGKVGYIDYAGEADLTESALPEWYKPTGFVRIELVAGDGTRAWSNPIFPTA